MIFTNAVCDSINYCKFRVCIDIFEEKGLVSLDRLAQTAALIKTEGKVDLEQSEILSALRSGESDIYASLRIR